MSERGGGSKQRPKSTPVGNVAPARQAAAAAKTPVPASGAKTLPAGVQTAMSGRFGHDFSQVRVFSDEQAHEMADSLEARAYTAGPNIVFGPGQYDPHSATGQRLLAHELTHVVQQARFGVPAFAQTRLNVSQPGDASEQEAESLADRVVAGQRVRVNAVPGAPTLARSLWDRAKRTMGGLADRAQNAVSGAAQTATNVYHGAQNVAARTWNNASHLAGRASHAVSGAAGRAWDGAKHVAGHVAGSVKSGARRVARAAGHTVNNVAHAVSGRATRAWNGAKRSARRAWDGAGHAAKRVGHAAHNVVHNVAHSVSGAGRRAWTGARRGAASVAHHVSDAAHHVSNSVARAGHNVAHNVEHAASRAWTGARRGVSSAAHAVKATASDVGNTLSYVPQTFAQTWNPVLHAKNPWEGAKKAGGIVYDGMKQNAELVRHGTEGFEHGVDWLENKASQSAHWAANQAKGIPVLEQVANAGAGMVDMQAQLSGGALKGAGGLVSGVLGMAANPVDTAKGLYTVAEHLSPVPGVPSPLKAAHGLYDVAIGGKDPKEVLEHLMPGASMRDDLAFKQRLVEGIVEPYAKSIREGKPAEAVGRGLFDVVTLIGTGGGSTAAKGAGVAGKAAEIANATSRVGKAAEAAEVVSATGRAAEVAKTAETVNAAAKTGEAVNTVAKTGEGAQVASDAARVTQVGKDAEVTGELARTSETLASESGKASQKIEHGLANGPLGGESASGLTPLKARHRRLLDELPESVSETVTRKKSVSMKDLRQLTNHTGDEFAMFTRKGKRIIMRGKGGAIPTSLLNEERAAAMAQDGWRFSGHTHTPGYAPVGSAGDKTILRAFGQRRSGIWSSSGKPGQFYGNAMDEINARLGISVNEDARVAERAASAGKKATETSSAAEKMAAEQAAKETYLKERMAELEAQGHGPARHGPHLTEQQLDDRAMHKIDPVTGTTSDAYKTFADGTPMPHKASRNATKVTSTEGYVNAEEYLRKSQQFADQTAAADAAGNTITEAIEAPLEEIFGEHYKSQVYGKTRQGSANHPTGTAETDFTDGAMKSYYRKDANGEWNLHTMYPEPK